MARPLPSRDLLLDAIRKAAAAVAHSPSRAEFFRHSGLNQRALDRHFNSWTEAVIAAGLVPSQRPQRPLDQQLLTEWGSVVRRIRAVPTKLRFRRESALSVDAFRRLGHWSAIPDAFRAFAANDPAWADVLSLLPIPTPPNPTPAQTPTPPRSTRPAPSPVSPPRKSHPKISGRSIYGNPIDFRGLRHEPVNEQGVVFLFGMVALELGYLVESIQTGFPDCEAKRITAPGAWQCVRIEFEFESRNFLDHAHNPDHCDLIVCWRHNWPQCPPSLEVLELSSILRTLPPRT